MFKATNIQWEYGPNEAPLLRLPKTVFIPEGIANDEHDDLYCDEITDYLSDKFGYLISGYSLETVPPQYTEDGYRKIIDYDGIWTGDCSGYLNIKRGDKFLRNENLFYAEDMSVPITFNSIEIEEPSVFPEATYPILLMDDVRGNTYIYMWSRDNWCWADRKKISPAPIYNVPLASTN